ncbi:hypothetical protein VDG1235_2451 [Verrucomicrobiia bacterium DG1235]|nr:hypothetical protein VDG1235_2451 [Verrucomicrobiae bacterium DG1235]
MRYDPTSVPILDTLGRAIEVAKEYATNEGLKINDEKVEKNEN